MTLPEEFQAATTKAKTLPPQSNKNLLILYGLFKQSTSGDVAGSSPNAFDLRAKAKYDAWATLRGTSREEAMSRYVETVTRFHSATN